MSLIFGDHDPVKDRYTGKSFYVYSISALLSGLKFLIYDEEGIFKSVEEKDFISNYALDLEKLNEAYDVAMQEGDEHDAE